MDRIVEVDQRGVIQLPTDVLVAVRPHTRFVLEVQGDTLVLHPVTALPFWQTATPQERAAAARRWAEQERPAALPLPASSLHRDQLYD